MEVLQLMAWSILNPNFYGSRFPWSLSCSPLFLHRNAVNAFKEGVVCVGLRTVVRPWLILGGRPRPEFWSVIPKAKTVLVCCQDKQNWKSLQSETQAMAFKKISLNPNFWRSEDDYKKLFKEILQYVDDGKRLLILAIKEKKSIHKAAGDIEEVREIVQFWPESQRNWMAWFEKERDKLCWDWVATYCHTAAPPAIALLHRIETLLFWFILWIMYLCFWFHANKGQW